MIFSVLIMVIPFPPPCLIISRPPGLLDWTALSKPDVHLLVIVVVIEKFTRFIACSTRIVR